MLGSFCMGLFAAASTLSLPTNKAMAILPANSRLQVRGSAPCVVVQMLLNQQCNHCMG